MTTPAKPWESLRNSNSSYIASDIVLSPNPIRGVRVAPSAHPGGVPALPPRQSRHQYVSRYPFGNGYGGYGAYGGYYGGYGAYGGYPYGGTGYRGEFENRYVQLAEESAAPAFESIEGFVRGFSSVTMMLESTYQAMHMSFRAVLGVAENMSKMKSAIIDFFSALAIFKTIYIFYRKLIHFLGVTNKTDMSWREAERAVLLESGTATVAKNASSKWPMIAFLGAIIAGPTLVYKYIFPPTLPDEEDVELIAMHDFDAEHPGEMSFHKGDRMFCKRSQLKKQWIPARKGSSAGFVPYNRVKAIAYRPCPPPVGSQNIAPVPQVTSQQPILNYNLKGAHTSNTSNPQLGQPTFIPVSQPLAPNPPAVAPSVVFTSSQDKTDKSPTIVYPTLTSPTKETVEPKDS